MSVDEIQHLIGVIGLIISVPLGIASVLAWPVPPVRDPIPLGWITVGGTLGDVEQRLAASTCAWCSAPPYEMHTGDCPYVA